MYHATWNKKKGGEAILISDKEVFKTKQKKDVKEHFVMTKVSIQQGDIIKKLIVFYVSNNRTPKYIKEKVIEQKGEIDISVIKLGDLLQHSFLRNSWKYYTEKKSTKM